jgi:hypothetical protein
MDFDKVLADLREQLQNLEVAIESLERLQNGAGSRRRGRPSNGSGPQEMARKTAGDTAGGKKRA